MATQSAAARANQVAKAQAEASGLLRDIPTAPVQKPEVISSSMLIMTYQIMADAITGQGRTDAPDSPGHISGIVTRADIEAIGGDFEWLLRSGAIAEAGYAPIS